EGPGRERRLPRLLGGPRGRRPRGRGRGGGALQPAQARQAPGALLRLGAARAGDALVPGGGGADPGRPRRRGLRLRPGDDPAGRGDGPVRPLGPPAGHLRAEGPRLPRHRPAGARPGQGRARPAPRGPRGVVRARRALADEQRARPRRARRARLAPVGPLRRRQARGARHHRAAPLAGPGLRVAHRPPGLPALLRRVQGDGDGLLRAAAAPGGAARAGARDRRRLLRRPRARLVALGAAALPRRHRLGARARRPGRVGAGAHRGGPGRPGHLAARAHRRPAPDDGRRHGAELRGEHADLARDALRGGLGAAGRRRLRHGAGRRAADQRRARARARADGHRRAGAVLGRRRPRGLAGAGEGAVHHPGRPGRRGRRRAGRRRGGRLVLRPRRVRAARPGAPLPAGAPRPRGQRGADERRQGPRAVPAHRADGAHRARRRGLHRRAGAEPVHALRARRAPAVARAHPRGGPRGRHGPDPDRRRHDQRRDRGPDPRLRGPHRAAGARQHQPEHRRPADGRRPPRRPGAVRLRPGGRAGPRPAPGAPRRAVRTRHRQRGRLV
ncbi:MAG: Carbamoyltransferase, partial [uncultured Quadrisphaera sp.]